MEILVVDDNVLDRKYIKYLLENHLNISPKTAKDGFDALLKIRDCNYDIVITDIVMPKIEGIELVNKIKDCSPNTNIIAVSGENPYYLYILKKMGIEMVFSKPLDTDNFLKCLNNLINNSSPKTLN